MKLDFVGNPYVGVYCTSSDNLLVISPTIPRRAVQRMSEALDIEAVRTNVGGSTVVGSLLRLNSHGAIVTDFAREDELQKLKGVNIAVVPHKLNAMGNNILCNDFGALVHPGYDQGFVKTVKDVLDVEVMIGTIAGIRTVGSWAVATNKGVLCHPHIRDDEKRVVEDLFKVPAVITTANYGTAQIGACIVANSQGAVVGSRTTPIEMGRIEEGLSIF